ncbi:hypothetical protein QVD17_28229 [Tagetes erecta]|uniref:Uncharacterized protein n=1 Tax=Tagetes erecta TaxID=13708 RepID=A0AAD8NS12_TARER|nr:hypothetical protein QVD17_28229 [Tagetes erecta]
MKRIQIQVYLLIQSLFLGYIFFGPDALIALESKLWNKTYYAPDKNKRNKVHKFSFLLFIPFGFMPDMFYFQ